MKKTTYILIGAVILLLSANVVFGQATWHSPSSAFSLNALSPKLPIDESSVPQTKEGELSLNDKLNFSASTKVDTIILPTENGIYSSDKSAYFIPLKSGLSAQSYLYNANGAFNINTQGIVLPNVSTSALRTPRAGTITYDPGVKNIKLYNGSAWVDVAGGTTTVTNNNTGSAFWKADGTKGIYYSGNSATIANNVIVQSGWYATGQTITSANLRENLALIQKTFAAAGNKPRMSCDTTDKGLECTASYYSGGGTDGDYGYDMYQTVTCPSNDNFGYWDLNSTSGKCDYYTNDGTYQKSQNPTYTTTYYKEFIHDTRVVSTNGPNTAVVSTGDINLESPKWSVTDPREYQIQKTNENVHGSSGYVEGWMSCPDGYFISAFRLGNAGGNLVPLFKCSTL